MKQYLIAHDLGTSGNKASLFSTDGELIRSYTHPYNVHFFSSNCAEQNPEDWWEAVCVSTREILRDTDPGQVLAISFSAQMQCCLVVDQNGAPLRPAIIWADQRAGKEADLLSRRVGSDRMYELTGHRVSASYSIEKLMWIKDHEPELYEKTYKMLQAKDYIIYRLTGRFVTDYSDASGTNALDLKALDWSDEILHAAGISRDKLPELRQSIDIAGPLTPDAARALSLTPDTLVVCGGGDGPCSALGAGCIKPNQMFLTFGTSAWIGGTTPEMFVDPDQTLFCFAHVIPGQYMPCGTTQSAGSVYSYIRKSLCAAETQAAEEAGQNPYDYLNSLIASSPAGAKNLIFLPYLLGERSPRWNPDTAGSYIGIKMHHTKADYVRAAVEGIAMNLELILAAYRRSLQVDHLILTGGGAKGDIIARILSDVLDVSLTRPDHVEEATSISAAMIAGVGIGIYPDFAEVSRFLHTKDTFTPVPENVKVYHQLKPLFDQGYDALKGLFKELSKI